MTTIATIGAGLVVSCHVNNELGTYIVWLLVGAGPMIVHLARLDCVPDCGGDRALLCGRDVGDAGGGAVAHASVSLRDDFVFDLLRSDLKLGAPMLLIQVVMHRYLLQRRVCVYDQIGWGRCRASSVAARSPSARSSCSTTGCGPTRPRQILLESLGASVERDRARPRRLQIFTWIDKMRRHRRSRRRLRISLRTLIFWN